MSPELRQELERWLENPEKSRGLCNYVGSATLRWELVSMFQLDGLCPGYPFNKGKEDFIRECLTSTMHLNPKRRQWVVDKLAKP